jgi:hypothetical protein
MLRQYHDRHARFFRLRPQPFNAAFGEQRPEQRPVKPYLRSNLKFLAF